MNINQAVFSIITWAIRHKSTIVFFIVFIGLLVVDIASGNPQPRLSGDAVSRALPALAPLFGVGRPYQDYWEIAPPGALLLFLSWAKLFGYSMFSWRILQILAVFGVGTFTYLILKRIFSPFYTVLIGILLSVVLLSPGSFSLFNAIFLSLELYGLFFSLAGLVSLLYLKKLKWRFFLSAFLLTLASQMKDPLGPAIIAILPPLIYIWLSRGYKSFLQASFFVVIGFFSVLIPLALYLHILGVITSYQEVLATKALSSHIFIWQNFDIFQSTFAEVFEHAKKIITLSQYSTFVMFWFWFFSLITALFLLQKKVQLSFNSKKNSLSILIPAKQVEISPHTLDVVTVFVYSIGSYLGFSLDGRMDFHYLIQIIPPIFFFWSILTKSTIVNFRIIFKSSKVNLLFLPLLLLILFPKLTYLKSYFRTSHNPLRISQSAYTNLTLPDGDSSFEQYIGKVTSPETCILSVYGWGVGETYFYSHRRPCSRFFLTNIILYKWQEQEYRQSLLRVSPGAIIYTKNGADMNVALFEKGVINLKKIVEQCYRQDRTFVDHADVHQNIFLPRYSGNELKECIQTNS